MWIPDEQSFIQFEPTRLFIFASFLKKFVFLFFWWDTGHFQYQPVGRHSKDPRAMPYQGIHILIGHTSVIIFVGA
jgi:hypothetical protein